MSHDDIPEDRDDRHGECRRYADRLEADVRDLGKGFDRLRAALEFVEAHTVPGPLLDVVRNALHDAPCGDVATSPPVDNAEEYDAEQTIRRRNRDVAALAKGIFRATHANGETGGVIRNSVDIIKEAEDFIDELARRGYGP